MSTGGNAILGHCDQSDRLVDLLLPVDSVVGLLAQAMDGVDGANGGNGGNGGNGANGGNPIGASYPQMEELPVAAAFDGAGEVDVEASPMETMENFPANGPQGTVGTVCVKSPEPLSCASLLLIVDC